MKKPNLRKSFAILTALITGGLGITLISLLPTAEAVRSFESWN